MTNPSDERIFDISERQIRELESRQGNYEGQRGTWIFNSSRAGPPVFDDGLPPRDGFLIDHLLAEVKPWARENATALLAMARERAGLVTRRAGRVTFDAAARVLAAAAVLATSAEEAMASAAYKSLGGEDAAGAERKVLNVAQKIDALRAALWRVTDAQVRDRDRDGGAYVP